MTNRPSITLDDVADELVGYAPATPPRIVEIFSHVVFGTADAMSKQKKDDFSWVRDDSSGAASFVAAFFLATLDIRESLTGGAPEEIDDKITAAYMPIALMLSKITFKTFNTLAGKENRMATPASPDPHMWSTLDIRSQGFFNKYIAPQLDDIL